MFLTDLSFSLATGCGGRGEPPADDRLDEITAVTQGDHRQSPGRYQAFLVARRRVPGPDVTGALIAGSISGLGCDRRLRGWWHDLDWAARLEQVPLTVRGRPAGIGAAVGA